MPYFYHHHSYDLIKHKGYHYFFEHNITYNNINLIYFKKDKDKMILNKGEFIKKLINFNFHITQILL